MGTVVIKGNDYEVMCNGRVVVISWRGRVVTFRVGAPEEEVNKLLSLVPTEVALAARGAIKEATRSAE